MNKYFKLLILVIISVFISGCASITVGSMQKVPVSSKPSGAVAKVDGAMAAVTPTVFNLERKCDHIIEISKEGYRTVTIALKRTLGGAVFGNALIGGIIGTAIDSGTGAMYKLVPEKVYVDLATGSILKSAEPVTSSKKSPEPAKLRAKQVYDQRSVALEPIEYKSYAPSRQSSGLGLNSDERLQRLDDFYRQGRISRAQYEAEKEVILGK